jgi:hypothetical protein
MIPDTAKYTDARPGVSPDPTAAPPTAAPVEAGTITPASTPPIRRGRGRPPGSKNKRTGNRPIAPHIIINEQRIYWSAIKQIYKRLGCNWDTTIDAFWKARHATGSNGIYRYTMSGFAPGKYGPAWIHLPSKERENGQMESIREWWIALYKPSEKRLKTIAIQKADVACMLASLTESLSL